MVITNTTANLIFFQRINRFAFQLQAPYILQSHAFVSEAWYLRFAAEHSVWLDFWGVKPYTFRRIVEGQTVFMTVLRFYYNWANFINMGKVIELCKLNKTNQWLAA